MKKRFIVALDSNTVEQNNNFQQYIIKNGYGWWHWIDGFWLLTNYTGELTSDELRDNLGEIYPGVNKLVIELRDDNHSWSGFGPNSGDKNMFKWLKENW